MPNFLENLALSIIFMVVMAVIATVILISVHTRKPSAQKIKVELLDGQIHVTSHDGQILDYALSRVSNFVEAIREDGDIRYCTPNLRHSTDWEKSIVVEGGFVKAINKDGDTQDYILIENGIITLIDDGGYAQYHAISLEHYTESGRHTSIAIKDGFLKLPREGTLYLNLKRAQ